MRETAKERHQEANWISFVRSRTADLAKVLSREYEVHQQDDGYWDAMHRYQKSRTRDAQAGSLSENDAEPPA